MYKPKRSIKFSFFMMMLAMQIICPLIDRTEPIKMRALLSLYINEEAVNRLNFIFLQPGLGLWSILSFSIY